MGSRLRIIVLGYIVRGPLGGMVWSNLHYLMGLARLGHDVFFLEDSDDYPSCYDPVRDVTDTDPTYGLSFTARTMERIGFADRWAYHDAHAGRWHGPWGGRVAEICADADLVLDLSGVNPLRPWLLDVPARALVDTDPAFTQIRHLTDPVARDRALLHTAFLSFGANIGQRVCSIPDDGLPWHPTRQPVVLDTLRVTPGRPQGRYTTVMLWHSYPVQEYAGVCYGLKAESFMPYMDLPARVGPVFELAVGSATAPHSLLRRNGWSVRDSRKPTRDLPTYESYIRRSKAEFSVAKHGYVRTWSGWFSERSVTYLASGRPVLVQDTGFSDWLSTGSGVLAFASPEEAIAGLGEIDGRYAHHCRAAREMAAEYFDAAKVLPGLIERTMARPSLAREHSRGDESPGSLASEGPIR